MKLYLVVNKKNGEEPSKTFITRCVDIKEGLKHMLANMTDYEYIYYIDDNKVYISEYVYYSIEDEESE